MARIRQFFELQPFTSKLSLKWPWTFRRYNYAFLAQSGHWGSFWALYVRLFTNSKKWSKKIFWPKMVEFGSVEISEPPKSTILGWGGWYIFSPHQRGSKALVKSFSCWPNHLGTPKAHQSRKLPKLGQKRDFAEISAPPKSTFLGWGGRNFFGPHQRGSKALVKSFWCRPNHFGALETSQSRKLLKLGPKMRFCRNFCTPKIDLFGAGWSKFFQPAPKGS